MQGKQPNSSEQLIRLFYSELFNQTEGSVKCHRASSLLLAACIARADKMVRTGVSLAEDGAEVWERLAESAKLLNDPTVRSLWTEYELGPLGTFETESAVTQYVLSFTMPSIYRGHLKRFKITDRLVPEDQYPWVD